MCYETSKARERRLKEGYFEKIFIGQGIDIGHGDDPVTPDCYLWDMPQGDAQELEGLAPESFDWVYSSHTLEHMVDAYRAIQRWWEVLKPGGKMLIVIPDEDLYEQGHWPSPWNGDHKHSFTIHKTKSWSPASINLTDLVTSLPNHKVLWMRLCDHGYRYSDEVYDRLWGPDEANLELLVQKCQVDE